MMYAPNIKAIKREPQHGIEPVGVIAKFHILKLCDQENASKLGNQARNLDQGKGMRQNIEGMYTCSNFKNL